MRLVWDKIPTSENGRNSEGSFIRQPDGGILFAYSRYSSNDYDDGASCDIAVIRSFDEGETWSEPEIIARSADYKVRNLMSVSAVYQEDQTLGIYFIIKENDGNNSIGRALSSDGYTFSCERCLIKGSETYYVLNNDRIERLMDGRLVIPVALHGHNKKEFFDIFAVSSCLVSEDDGKTFSLLPIRLTIPALKAGDVGMQEPGIIQYPDGTIYLWARTSAGFQYESYSHDNLVSFTPPTASVFTSPDSPLEIAEHEGIYYAVYNPVARNAYVHRNGVPYSWSRTPLVIRKSTDNGKTWGPLTPIEEDENRGYCYPAMFFTKDNSMLCAYCRGGEADGICLARLGIMKISLDEIK